ncbi:MAG TPA: acetolactate synthase [Acidimicrobiia bacterium]|jgi:acetolactate synthase-1/2/3 large subunit|nr:acetolactate synthase [Acidimicrobiia bacterium]
MDSSGGNPQPPGPVHGGNLAAGALKDAGVDVVFTLSGGHIFPLYDGCVAAGIRLVDTRHEQTAGFAAEGWAKVTRQPGVAALTAGPGVTNGMSAITSAFFCGSPMVVIGGRAPAARWGSGSLQEVDHVPIVAEVTKRAVTAQKTGDIYNEVVASILTAAMAPRGPTFVDIPVDQFFDRAAPPDGGPLSALSGGRSPDTDALARVAKLIADAERPVIMAGAGVYWDRAEEALEELAEAAGVPVLMNGLGRGTLRASHLLAFSRARSTALRKADLVIAAGVPLDFRLGFGQFGGGARVVHLMEHPSQIATHVELAGSAAGDLSAVFRGIVAARVEPSRQKERAEWVADLSADETARREKEEETLRSQADPIHPARIYGELRDRLQPDAVVVVDGGDFGSYAGKLIDTETPGAFLDPGPYGCLGTGPGYGLAARLAAQTEGRPDRQVFILLGDGAAGFSLMDFDTLVRHEAPVVAIVGNNGIWGLEKHPMQALYGYDVVAELRPGTRYDQVVEALGGHGELVTDPAEIGPAIDRALASGVPALVNVLTDPADVYPRSSSLM